jgi:hypothetical protein
VGTSIAELTKHRAAQGTGAAAKGRSGRAGAERSIFAEKWKPRSHRSSVRQVLLTVFRVDQGALISLRGPALRATQYRVGKRRLQPR